MKTTGKVKWFTKVFSKCSASFSLAILPLGLGNTRNQEKVWEVSKPTGPCWKSRDLHLPLHQHSSQNSLIMAHKHHHQLNPSKLGKWQARVSGFVAHRSCCDYLALPWWYKPSSRAALAAGLYLANPVMKCWPTSWSLWRKELSTDQACKLLCSEFCHFDRDLNTYLACNSWHGQQVLRGCVAGLTPAFCPAAVIPHSLQWKYTCRGPWAHLQSVTSHPTLSYCAPWRTQDTGGHTGHLCQVVKLLPLEDQAVHPWPPSQDLFKMRLLHSCLTWCALKRPQLSSPALGPEEPLEFCFLGSLLSESSLQNGLFYNRWRPWIEARWTHISHVQCNNAENKMYFLYGNKVSRCL